MSSDVTNTDPVAKVPDSKPTDLPTVLRNGYSEGYTVLGYVIAGPLFYGGLGWLADRYLFDTGLLLPAGIIVGFVASIYLIARRYRHDDHPSSDQRSIDSSPKES